MKIKHFGGIEFANDISELSEILRKRYGDDSNEFWLSNNIQELPCLAILVHKDLANLTYFPDEASPGYQAAGCRNQAADAYSVFYTNTPEEEIEISTVAVIPFNKAYEAAQKFFDTYEMPDNIEWAEN